VNEALNHGNNEIIPIIWQINKYNTVENLVGLRACHHHDHVTTDLLRKGGSLHSQKDHWVKIKRIFKRVKDVMGEKGVESLKEAARELDVHERRTMSLNQYAEYLRTSTEYCNRYSGNNKRKRD
jgi:hypothetical protein